MNDAAAPVDDDARDLLRRLDAVEGRIAALAAAETAGRLTRPDPGGDERWDDGQVWAHIAEFPAYWMGQIRIVAEGRAAGGGGTPDAVAVPFGRVKTDPHRIAAIELLRHDDRDAMLERVETALADVRETLLGLSADDWRAPGRHPTLGEMSVAGVVQRFVVGHLEEHAAQLEELAAAR